jgi:hypothetical protein
MTTPRSKTLVLVLVLALVSGATHAQVPPGGMPSPQEIERRLDEEFEKLPDQESTLKGAKLTYKAIPTDAGAAIKKSGQLPPGIDPDMAARQYGPMARPYIEKYCKKIGKLRLEKAVKVGSKTIEPGDYVVGLAMENLAPVAVFITGGELKSPIQLPLKGHEPPAPHETAKLELKAGKKAGEFTIAVAFGRVEGEAGKLAFKK